MKVVITIIMMIFFQTNILISQNIQDKISIKIESNKETSYEEFLILKVIITNNTNDKINLLSGGDYLELKYMTDGVVSKSIIRYGEYHPEIEIMANEKHVIEKNVSDFIYPINENNEFEINCQYVYRYEKNQYGGIKIKDKVTSNNISIKVEQIEENDCYKLVKQAYLNEMINPNSTQITIDKYESIISNFPDCKLLIRVKDRLQILHSMNNNEKESIGLQKELLEESKIPKMLKELYAIGVARNYYDQRKKRKCKKLLKKIMQERGKEIYKNWKGN